MARLPILEKTIKILFAHSGNKCAFPDCEQALVEGNNIIADICHIEAANEEGERYNPHQTDEERRDEENLILLCATHHRVTNDVNQFTVEALKNMKTSHKSKYLSDQYDLNDTILKRIVHLTNNQKNINNIYGQVENITINQIQNNGITKIEDITELFILLFNANFPKVLNCAKQVAISHIKRFASNLSEALKSEGIDIREIENAFIDPDMQHVFNSAVQSVARSGKEELITILSKLIIVRIKNWENNDKKHLLNEAISTVYNLSKKQLDMLTASFLMYDYIRSLSIIEWNDLNSYFSQVSKFLHDIPNEMDFRHISYTRCASFNNGIPSNYSKILKNSFPILFQKSGFQKAVNIQQETIDNLVCQNLKLGSLLIRLTMSSKLRPLDLSSVGIIIAAAHFEVVTKSQLNLDHYFNNNKNVMRDEFQVA